MTVGALFLPMGMPILLSDSLVVWKTGPKILESLKPEVMEKIKGAPKASLVRKAYFLEDGLAILYSGHVKDFSLAHSVLSEAWQNLCVNVKPLEERLTLLKPENLNPYNVSAILVLAHSGTFSRIGSNILGADTKRFGPVLTIGSGGRELLDQTLAWESAISHLPFEDLTLDSSHLISEFIGAHRNRKLFFSTHLNSAEHWGGYIEAFILDSQKNIWLQTSDWVHLVCKYEYDRFLPLYPYFIYKRCDDGVQRLFKVQPGFAESWEIKVEATQVAQSLDAYYGPFGPKAKISISVIDESVPNFHHATSMYYQDGKFPTDTPEVCEYLNDHIALFDEIGNNFRKRKDVASKLVVDR